MERRSIFGPLLLIGAGVFLFLNVSGFFSGDIWWTLIRLWPLLLIVGGLDGLYQRHGFTGPLVLIGLGTIFLLSSLGYMNYSIWSLLWRLWPVILIGFGLDLIIGRRSAWAAGIGILLGLLLIGAVLWFAAVGPLGTFSSRADNIQQELIDATSVRVEILPAVGQLTLGSGTTGKNLVEGTTHLVSNETLNTSYQVNGGQGNFLLESKGVFVYPFFDMNNQMAWDLKLNPKFPLDLVTKLNVGEQNADLTGLTLKSINIKTIIGKTVLTLPASGGYHGEATIVIGDLVVRIPKDLAVKFTVHKALSTASFPSDFEKQNDTAVSPIKSSNPAEIYLDVVIGSMRVEYTP